MNAAGAVLSIFFLVFGIDLCRAAYHLQHPYQFIITFFASNLIILISVVFLAGVVVRVVSRLRHGQPRPGV
ncbi:MAG: hypothetical protein JSU72_02250 [Deltaproteobacteria bacterium]|nr:MAG: hypothetical protein JSU72_02250 [Deltaproteobacteria bacterium]